MTLGIDIKHNSMEWHYVECHYAECRDYLNVTLRVIRLNVIMLCVDAANDVMVSKRSHKFYKVFCE